MYNSSLQNHWLLSSLLNHYKFFYSPNQSHSFFRIKPYQILFLLFLEQENRYKVGTAIFLSIFLDYVLYSFIAAYGYLSFCDNTKSDIIQSYTGGGWINGSLRLILCISICSTYPMAGYPARYALNNSIKDLIELFRKEILRGVWYDYCCC